MFFIHASLGIVKTSSQVIIMLIQVVDEQPAQPNVVPADETTTTTEYEILAHLVTHFAQPIHVPQHDSSLPYFAIDDSSYENMMQQAPVVTKYCQTQLLQSTRDGQANGGDASASIRKLLQLYPTRIRPAVFEGEIIQATGVAVLYQFDWLLTLLSYDKQAPPLQRRHDEDGAASDAMTPLGAANGRLRRSTESDNDLLETTIKALSTDLGRCVPIAVHLAMSCSSDDDRDKKSDKIQLHHFHAQQYVIPIILRLLRKSLSLCAHNENDDIIQQVAVRLLAWTPPPHCVGPLQVAPSLQEALEPSSLCAGSHLPEDITAMYPLLWPTWDWNQAVELSSADWNCPAASQCAADIWKDWSLSASEKDDLCQRQKVCMKTWDWGIMTRAVRRHFFGKDEETEDDYTLTRTRLHLGRTVPDKPVEYEKPFRAIPSRMHAACVFISLLDAVNGAMLQDLVPILYELLAAPQEAIQAMGAALLHRLLDISQGQQFLWTPILLSNFAAALDLAVQTCRQGAVLTVLGVTQVVVLRRQQQGHSLDVPRGKACQQWFMILHKNLHNVELVWGVLTGAVLRFGLDYVACEPDGGGALELGRLALSCLLPLIRRDDGTASGATTAMGSEIQWLALVALSHWLVAAHAVMVRHDGKLLGSLLLCLGRNKDETSATFGWARHVAAMVVVAVNCGDCSQVEEQGPVRSAKLEQVIESGVYEERLVAIARQILYDAQILKDKLWK